MNREYIEEKQVMPISISTYKPDPTHRLIAASECNKIMIPYLKELDGKIFEAGNKNCDKFVIIADRKITARKAALYIKGIMDGGLTFQFYSDHFFAEDENNDMDEEPDNMYGYGDCLEDEEPGISLNISILEEISLETPKEEDQKRPRNYRVSQYTDAKATGIIVTGLEDGTDLEEKLDAVKSYNGCAFLWIPKSLQNDRNIYELELLEGYMAIEVREPEDDYYGKLLSNLAKKSGVALDEGLSERDIILRLKRRLGDRLSEECIDRALQRATDSARIRDSKKIMLRMSDFFPEFKPQDTAIERLNRLIGLENVKTAIKENLAMSKERIRNKKLFSSDAHTNMIFCGNPGTGKTTLGQLFADCLCECGASNGVFLSVTRQDLVGKYVGHSAPKVAEAFKRARGGILFVDEAGFFLNQDSGGYLSEVLKEFVRFMEIEPLVTVIFSMYEDEADRFLTLDSGLRSRITRVVKFEDYSREEIKRIAESMYKSRGYTTSRGALDALGDYIEGLRERRDFGNARDVRRAVDCSISAHSVRLYFENNESTKDPDIITVDDVKNGISIASKMPKSETHMNPIGFMRTEADNKLCS